MIILCRCGAACRVLQGKKHELLIEVTWDLATIRLHRCPQARRARPLVMVAEPEPLAPA